MSVMSQGLRCIDGEANATEMCGGEDAVEMFSTPMGHELAKYPAHIPAPGKTKARKVVVLCAPADRASIGNRDLMGKWRSLKLRTLVLPSLLLFLFYGASGAHCSMAHGNMTDRRSLLDFKEAITDPTGALHSWNDSIHHCMWSGVSCSIRHPGRVTKLDLSVLNLTGQIAPFIGNLTFLKELNLSYNHFSGQLPPLSRLKKLEVLVLYDNLLQGNILDAFTALTNCSKLTDLGLSANMLVGSIPRNIGSLSNLDFLGLSRNNITGAIPPTFSNMTRLVKISLGYNQLEGRIPEELGQLLDMETVILGGNRLSGRVPATLFNLSHLSTLDLSMNMLNGHIPDSVGNALELEALDLYGNQLGGGLPHSVGNLSSMILLDLGANNFCGTIPRTIGGLPYLQQLKLRGNNFVGPIP